MAILQFTVNKIHFRNLIHDESENKPTGETKWCKVGFDHFVTQSAQRDHWYIYRVVEQY